MKYKYLYAWDVMMASYPYWIKMNQQRAELENAPVTAIYRNIDGKWVTFEDIKRPSVKQIIANMVGGMKHA